ncbi:MAG: hypothetical protein AMXMBFR6_10280 [Betaproteobacteria bacterium]|nr:hypothetical protein [Rhodocyclaceae bacterium]
MVQAISATTAQKGRKRLALDGFEYFKTTYLGPALPEAGWDEGPLPRRPAQAFLVEQLPNTTVDTHFHCVNQFQVIVQGGGQFGRHPIRPGAVHYAGAYTGYGPIEAGEEGVSYFTLRAQCDFGAHFLPASRSELRDVERRFILADDVQVSREDDLATLKDASLETIIPADDTGLAGYLARLGPGTTLVAPPAAAGGGQYWVVLSGALNWAGETLPAKSCVFISPGDPAMPMAALDRGAEVLVLQYPRSPEPRARGAARAG